MGKRKTSFRVDEDLWNEFSYIIVKNRGNRHISQTLEELIDKFVKNNRGK